MSADFGLLFVSEVACQLYLMANQIIGFVSAEQGGAIIRPRNLGRLARCWSSRAILVSSRHLGHPAPSWSSRAILVRNLSLWSFQDGKTTTENRDIVANSMLQTRPL
jgi:hypothetical protein